MVKLLQQLKNGKEVINSAETGMKALDDEDLKRLQAVLLEMLLDVLAYCRSNDIDVFLLGGSSLGAVRHHGFIPWDDDIDIGMTRLSYQLFAQSFEADMNGRYTLNAPNRSKKAITRFPKILKTDSLLDIGVSKDPAYNKVFIDIFIVDAIPMSRIHRKLKQLRCDCLEFIGSQVACEEYLDDISKKQFKSGGKLNYSLRKAVGKLFSFRSSTHWYNLVDKAVQYHKGSNLWGLPTGSRHYGGEIFDRSVFLPVSTGVFEGHEVPLVHDPDAYMRNLYGNYMQIPPPEKRQKHFVREMKL